MSSAQVFDSVNNIKNNFLDCDVLISNRSFSMELLVSPETIIQLYQIP